MNKIAELIKRFCPDGVKYRELQELADIGTGSSDRKDASQTGPYPFYVRSKDILRKDSYEFDEEAVIIPGEGGIGEIFHYVNGKYALHQRVYRIHVMDEKLDAKFLKYYMEAQFKSFISKKAVSATVTSIRKPMIQHFFVPIPPMEVQEEIVRVLDSLAKLEFELEVKLQEELEARKAQYAYYREKLLSFENCAGGGSLRFLKDLGEIFSGLTGKTRDDFGKGSARYVTYKNIFSNMEVDLSICEAVQIEQSERQNMLHKGDILFTASSETAQDCGISSVVSEEPEQPTYLNSFSFGFRPYDHAGLSAKYCKHLFRSNVMRSQIAKTANGVTRFNISKRAFSNIKVPIPPRDVQRKTADVLDKFDAMANEIAEDILVEIGARRRQYEYYRDKLLAFKEKTV